MTITKSESIAVEVIVYLESIAVEVIVYLEEAMGAVYRKQFDRAQWRCVEAAGLLSRLTNQLCRTGRGFELLDHGPKGIATVWSEKPSEKPT